MIFTGALKWVTLIRGRHLEARVHINYQLMDISINYKNETCIMAFGKQGREKKRKEKRMNKENRFCFFNINFLTCIPIQWLMHQVK